jgi:hypothetical protein
MERLFFYYLSENYYYGIWWEKRQLCPVCVSVELNPITSKQVVPGLKGKGLLSGAVNETTSLSLRCH